jgi:hypothetical protein
MNFRLHRFTLGWLGASLALALAGSLAAKDACAADMDDARVQAQLQRHIAIRTRLERERAQRDNEVRAFSGVGTGAVLAAADNPGVSTMRATLQQTLLQQGDMLKCNDIEVDNGAGSVVVVCGSETGGVNSTRTVVGGDLVNLGGGAP